MEEGSTTDFSPSLNSKLKKSLGGKYDKYY